MPPERSSSIDPLTGVFTRRYLLDRLRSGVDAALVSRAHAAVLFVVVDEMGQINERLGHFAADRALSGAAAEMFRTLSADDVIGRHGANEFVVLIPGGEAQAVMLLAERLRRAIEGLHLIAGHAVVRITISIGVAWLAEVTGDVEPARELVSLAEARASEARTRGGNRVSTTSARA